MAGETARRARPPGGPAVAGRSASLPQPGELARVVHRVAVLLGAGVAPAAAWRHAAGLDPPRWAWAIADAARRSPTAVPDAIRAVAEAGRARAAPKADTAAEATGARTGAAASLLGVAAMWRVAAVAGAPIAPALRAAVEALRAEEERRRAAAVALAGPAATIRLVIAMPLVAVAFGALLGYDTIGVLTGTPIGWACVVGGVALLLVARAWGRRLVAAATRAESLPGLESELLAIAMGGGGAHDRARSLVVETLADLGLPARLDDADESVAIAVAAGAPVAELLRAEAQESRRAAAATAASRTAALETSHMIPLGVCALPAFFLLGVVPLLVAVMSSTIAAI